jgi:hypothetical protein
MDTLVNNAKPWTRCLLVGTPRTYFREVVSQGKQSENRDRRIKSAWERKRIGRIEISERRHQREIIRDYEKTNRRDGKGCRPQTRYDTSKYDINNFISY